ncbi:MAG: VOC family protein [Blastocatellia bacterium]|nr:VOC family protein [Blastocatellia bacterium]
MLNQIGQIALTVTNLDTAVAFYRDKLGMAFLFQTPNLAFFDCLGVRFMLGLPEAESPRPGGSVIYFRVEDIKAAYQELAEQGVNFKDQPHLVAKLPDREVWMTFFSDLDGNLLALMSEVSLL